MKRAVCFFICLCAAAVSCTTVPSGGKPGALFSLEMRFVETGIVDETHEYKMRGSQERLVLEDRVLFDRGDIISASAVKDEYGGHVVDFQFNRESSQRFSDLTESNQGRRIAIVVNGEIVTAPVIMMPIRGGKVRISYSFTKDEAADLAEKLSGK